MNISGVIWDYDGTLVDTRMKNLNVTKAIIKEIIGDLDINNSVLNSIESYEQANVKSSNWRELYRNEFGLTEEQIDNAGKLWTKFQLLDKTKVQLFEGIGFVVQKLSIFTRNCISKFFRKHQK